MPARRLSNSEAHPALCAALPARIRARQQVGEVAIERVAHVEPQIPRTAAATEGVAEIHANQRVVGKLEPLAQGVGIMSDHVAYVDQAGPARKSAQRTRLPDAAYRSRRSDRGQ